MAVQHKAAITYKDENGGGYWDDLIEIHNALGLSVTLGDAVAISPLVSYFITVLISKLVIYNTFDLHSLHVY
jgi:hypothetical protein